MSISLTNSKDLIVNSLSLVSNSRIEDMNDIFLSKLEAVSNIIGLDPSTMNTLERISAALDDDEHYFSNNQISLNQKSDLVYVKNQLLLKKIQQVTLQKLI